ncbi:MAG: PilZ domain-containing protein [Pseudomonadota bacterium]
MEKRNNLRANISTTVKIKLVDNDIGNTLKSLKKPISKTADNASRQTVPSTSSRQNKRSFSISDFPSSIEEVNNPLISYLLDSVFLLNDKLDKILDLLEDNKDEIKVMVKEAVNISGTGMKLILYSPVKKGQLLDISLNIPGFPVSGFNTYGEVIHTKIIQKKDTTLYEVGVKFINILEEEREMLIAYAFSQERRQIRQCKDTIS